METLGLAWTLALVVAAAAAITDARTGHIPNWITRPPLVIGPLLHGLMAGPLGLGLSLIAVLVCGAVPYAMFRRDALGGGDVKLFAALGALTGPVLGIEMQLYGLCAGAVWAAVVLAYRGRLVAMLGNALRIALNPLLPARMRREIPTELMAPVRLGAPILVGVALSLASRLTNL
jgi:prepilin peptidase CpaA